MRTNIVHPGAGELHYEIRGIVELANQVAALGTTINWENIGDPVAKGEVVPEWIREIVKAAIDEPDSFAYSPTQGLLATREYIARERNLEGLPAQAGGIQITPNDILFFNGLGDAISKLYSYLHPGARILGPNPAYPTHSSAEAAHAGSAHLTYPLDPDNGWAPDLDVMEQRINEHPEIAGILIINPDNPTGFVYPQDTNRQIVALAKKYGLFIISDEIYSNLAFPDGGMQKLASVIGDVPGIAMRGISKEFPWPGSRCGWVEFYNRDKDETFNTYCTSLINAKMLEVCSTTQPQKVLPRVMSDERYFPYLDERIARYQARSKAACEALNDIPGLAAIPAQGAFYLTVVFDHDALTSDQVVPMSDEARLLVEPKLSGATPDQRFVYQLLAATGICVVPLSTGFNATRFGFRMTLLERDDERFQDIITRLAEHIRAYLAS